MPTLPFYQLDKRSTHLDELLERIVFGLALDDLTLAFFKALTFTLLALILEDDVLKNQ